MLLSRLIHNFIKFKTAYLTALFFAVSTYFCGLFYPTIQSELNRELFRYFYIFCTMAFVCIEALVIGRLTNFKRVYREFYRVFRLSFSVLTVASFILIICVTAAVWEQLKNLFAVFGKNVESYVQALMFMTTNSLHGLSYFRTDLIFDSPLQFIGSLPQVVRLIALSVFTIVIIRLIVREFRPLELNLIFATDVSVLPTVDTDAAETIPSTRLAVGYVYKPIP